MRNLMVMTVLIVAFVGCVMRGAPGSGGSLESRMIDAPRERVFAALADEDNMVGMRKVTDTGQTAVYELPLDSESAKDGDELLTVRLTRPSRIEISLSGDDSAKKHTLTADLTEISEGKRTQVNFNANIGESDDNGGSNARFTAKGRDYIDNWLDLAEKKVKS